MCFLCGMDKPRVEISFKINYMTMDNVKICDTYINILNILSSRLLSKNLKIRIYKQ
jgi:hypothetical protein